MGGGKNGGGKEGQGSHHLHHKPSHQLLSKVTVSNSGARQQGTILREREHKGKRTLVRGKKDGADLRITLQELSVDDCHRLALGVRNVIKVTTKKIQTEEEIKEVI